MAAPTAQSPSGPAVEPSDTSAMLDEVSVVGASRENGAPNVLVVSRLTCPVSGKSVNSEAAARIDDPKARPNIEPAASSGVGSASAVTMPVSTPFSTPRLRWRSRQAVSP